MARKELLIVKKELFLQEDKKSDICVGFSKKEFKNHKGVAGLKYYLIVMYLRKHFDIFGEVTLTLNRLLEECGYSTKSHNKSTYTDFRNIIQFEIVDKGYATVSDDIMTISPTKMFSIYLSSEKSLFFTEDNFVLMSIKEFEKISSFDETGIGKSVLVGVYLFIKQFIVNNVYDSLQISYPSKQQIKSGIGLSSIRTVEKSIANLINLGMLYVKSDMYIEHSEEENVYVPTRNVFALNKDALDCDEAILSTLSGIYGKTVYRKEDLPGKATFLAKQT